MLPLETHVARLGGATTRQQLLATGASGWDITKAVREGRIIRIRQARYVTSGTAQEVVVASRVGGMLAGPSATRSHGLWGGFDRVLHVAVARTASRLRTAVPPRFATAEQMWADRPRARIRLHWVEEGRVPERGPECWRVPLIVALRQVATWCDRETSLAALDTALTSGAVTAAALERGFTGLPVAVRSLASAARVGSDSGPESIVCRRLGALGLRVHQQVRIDGIGRVDMLVGSRVVIEVDGRTYHQDPVAFEEDRRRDAELVARGYVVIRLSYLRVATDWAWCERMILAALAR